MKVFIRIIICVVLALIWAIVNTITFGSIWYSYLFDGIAAFIIYKLWYLLESIGV